MQIDTPARVPHHISGCLSERPSSLAGAEIQRDSRDFGREPFAGYMARIKPDLLRHCDSFIFLHEGLQRDGWSLGTGYGSQNCPSGFHEL